METLLHVEQGTQNLSGQSGLLDRTALNFMLHLMHLKLPFGT